MTDQGTFDGPMPVTKSTLIISLVCSFGHHSDCDLAVCECRCHVEQAAA